jgi:hypothetical protein
MRGHHVEVSKRGEIARRRKIEILTFDILEKMVMEEFPDGNDLPDPSEEERERLRLRIEGLERHLAAGRVEPVFEAMREVFGTKMCGKIVQETGGERKTVAEVGVFLMKEMTSLDER